MIALVVATLGAPLAHAGLVIAASRLPRVRDVVHIAGALLLAGLLVALALGGGRDAAPIVFARPLPGATLAFAADPLGVVTAAAIALLSVLCAIYTVGWMRFAGDRNPARFMTFAALASGAAVGVALAANLFTLFAFYELLTLATFPLVAHERRASGGEDGSAALYLLAILGLGVLALLPAVAWVSIATTGGAFTPNGALTGKIDAFGANVLLLLFVFGTGLSGLFPAHRWMTATAGSIPPASAAVLGLSAAAGGFCILRVASNVFGEAMGLAGGARVAILVVAILTALGASLAAFSQRSLSGRLAYLCVGQLALVTAGAMLGVGGPDGGEGWFAAALQLIAYMIATVTLCLAAGAIDATVGESDLDAVIGFGRRAPLAFTAFALAALSFAGAPPLAGAWPKLWLMIAAMERSAFWAALAIAVTALAAFGALAIPAVRALFAPLQPGRLARPDGAPLLMIAPTVVGALASLLLLVWLDPIARTLAALRGFGDLR